MTSFATWVVTDAERAVRVDLKAWTGSSEESLYIATHDLYGTYLGRLMSPLVIRRSIGGAFGRRAESSVSAIVIDNSDRALDAWIDYGWHGRTVEIKMGSPDWTSGDAGWTTRFVGVAEKIEADDLTLTLFVRDSSERLNRPIVEAPLSMHPSSWLTPYPLCIGTPKNITPQLSGIYTNYHSQTKGTQDGNFQVNAWNAATTAAVSSIVSEVYESGKTSAKSLNLIFALVGGGRARFNHNVNDPEGTVTCDPVGATDQSRTVGGNRLAKAGESLDYLFQYTIGALFGFAQDGDADHITLDDKASDTDDYYNGAGTDESTQGYILVASRGDAGATKVEENNVSDYDGGDHEVTFGASMGFTVVAGDPYLVFSPDDIAAGPLASGEIDSSALSTLDSDAGYDLGIYDSGGQMTYLDLLDTIFPAGFWYYWTPAGKITCGLLADPSDDSATITIDDYATRGKIRLVQEDAPYYRVRVGYDRNWTVQNAADLDVDTDRIGFVSREYLWEISEDLSVLDAYPEAIPRDYPSFIIGRADAQTEADRLMALFGTARKRLMIEGLSEFFNATLHDVVTLTDDDYGHSGGVDYRIISMEERPIEGTVDVELWG